MISKNISLFFLLLTTTLLVSCGDIVPYTSISNSALVSQNKNIKDIQQSSGFFNLQPSPSTNPTISEYNSPTPNPSSLFIIEPDITKNSNNNFKFINKGKFNDTLFPIGSKKNEILSKLGIPNDKGGVGGTEWFTFGYVTYFTAPGENDQNITILVTQEGFDIEGLKLGATTSQIKERFGKPRFEGITRDDTGDSIFGDGDYLIDFDIENKYFLIFVIDTKNKNKSTSVYLLKKLN